MIASPDRHPAPSIDIRAARPPGAPRPCPRGVRAGPARSSPATTRSRSRCFAITAAVPNRRSPWRCGSTAPTLSAADELESDALVTRPAIDRRPPTPHRRLTARGAPARRGRGALAAAEDDLLSALEPEQRRRSTASCSKPPPATFSTATPPPRRSPAPSTTQQPCCLRLNAAALNERGRLERSVGLVVCRQTRVVPAGQALRVCRRIAGPAGPAAGRR